MKKLLKKVAFVSLYIAAAARVFATGGDIMPGGMTTLAESIIEVFTGPFVKAILIIMLAGCAVAYAFNKDNEKMKRNIIAIAVAIGILVGATEIVDVIWKASGK